jgi:hypothetical protein
MTVDDAPKSFDSDPNGVQIADDAPMCDESTNFGVDEKKLVRKLDLHIIPLVMLLCELKPVPALS